MGPKLDFAGSLGSNSLPEFIGIWSTFLGGVHFHSGPQCRRGAATSDKGVVGDGAAEMRQIQF